MGLEKECRFVEELMEMSDEEIGAYDCVIVDEAQFCKKAEIECFVHVVDDLNIPVICYGQGASCNTRFNEKGEIIRDGEQICLGADDKYVALCRKHYKEGKLAP